MSLTITRTEKEKGIITLSLEGRLDSDTAADLEMHVEKVMALDPRALVFDMAKLEYISSMGLRVAFKTLKQMRKKGGDLLMINLQKQIKKVFDIAQALPPESIFTSIEEADAYLDTMQRKALGEDD